MDETLFGLRVTVPLEYHQAIELAKNALKQEGFVSTATEVQETLEQELNVEFRQYTILGVCNPSLTHRGLQAEVGLPCNVVVYETGPRESVVVLEGVAQEADERLRRVLQSMQAAPASRTSSR